MRLFLFPFLVAMFAAPAQAEPYEIDPDHASITFAVDHLGFSMVRGRFLDFTADIDFDPEDPVEASISLTIQADSVNSFSRARDSAVKGKSLLYVSKYPTITFVSKSVDLERGNKARVTGDLTIRGITREETFEVTMRRAAVNELTQMVTAGFSVDGSIDRQDYGMNFGVPAIGAEVVFNFDIEAVLADQ